MGFSCSFRLDTSTAFLAIPVRIWDISSLPKKYWWPILEMASENWIIRRQHKAFTHLKKMTKPWLVPSHWETTKPITLRTTTKNLLNCKKSTLFTHLLTSTKLNMQIPQRKLFIGDVQFPSKPSSGSIKIKLFQFESTHWIRIIFTYWWNQNG